MSLPTPEEVARALLPIAPQSTRSDLAAAIRADRLRVLDACREEVRLAVYNKGSHRSVGYCLGKLMVRLDDMRREIEQP